MCVCSCVCVARLLALLANALESSQVFVATLIAAAGSELLSSRAHVTEARQSPIELDWTAGVNPNHWTTAPFLVYTTINSIFFGSCRDQHTHTHRLTHTSTRACVAQKIDCGDRLWLWFIALEFDFFFLTRAYSCQWPNQMHSQCSTSMQMHSNNNNWVNGKHKIWLQQKAKNKRITRTRTEKEAKRCCGLSHSSLLFCD